MKLRPLRIEKKMNSLRFMSRTIRPMSAASRRAFTAVPTQPNIASKGKKFVPKNFKEAWLSDVGVSESVLMVVV